MALDSVVEAAIRFVVDAICELLLKRLFYWPGWLVLRVLTLGSYPPRDAGHSEEFVGLVGFAVLVVIAIWLL